MNILTQNVSKKIVLISISIIVLVALSVSTTYSLIYNSKKLSNNTYTTGVLDIKYTEGETLELKNNIPLTDEEGILTTPYTITITNTGTLTYKFNLDILSTTEDIENIINPKYLMLQIDDNDPVSLIDLPNGNIYSSILLAPQETMEINIKMWLKEDTPNTEIGHTYSAKLVATGLAIQNKNENLHTTSLAYRTLVSLGLDKYAVESTTEEGILETQDEEGYLYYFKGNINYNYVLLNGKYYRIYLVDSKGNIKLIYSGTKAHENNDNDASEKDTVIGVTKFQNLNNFENATGYTYLDESIKEIDSNIKIQVDNWYKENIENTEVESNIVDVIYCNDKRTNAETGIYNSYERISDNKPDLSCSPADSYTKDINLGNGTLTYPIGLITLDELLLVNSDYINNNIGFWTMTAANFKDNVAYNYSYIGKKIAESKVDDELGIRPVITIKKDNLTGLGTATQPFTLKVS